VVVTEDEDFVVVLVEELFFECFVVGVAAAVARVETVTPVPVCKVTVAPGVTIFGL
jgi:hypothetical protein